MRDFVTELDAQKLWCPLARENLTEDYPANRLTSRDMSVRSVCIASKCMAWRWGSGEDGWTHVTPTGEKFCASTMESLKKAEAQGFTPLGYCGLGGRP